MGSLLTVFTLETPSTSTYMQAMRSATACMPCGRRHSRCAGSLHDWTHLRSLCGRPTNLFESFNDWIVSVQAQKFVTVACIDFAKAFDIVSRAKLLHSY